MVGCITHIGTWERSLTSRRKSTTRLGKSLVGQGPGKSRSCGLKLERPLRVAGVVAVGSGDVDVAVQAQKADGQTTRSDAITRGAFPVLTSDLSSW